MRAGTFSVKLRGRCHQEHLLKRMIVDPFEHVSQDLFSILVAGDSKDGGRSRSYVNQIQTVAAGNSKFIFVESDINEHGQINPIIGGVVSLRIQLGGVRYMSEVSEWQTKQNKHSFGGWCNCSFAGIRFWLEAGIGH